MMSRKGTVIWLSFVLVFSFIVVIVEIAPVVKAPTIWYVDDVAGSGGSGDPPEDFTSIQDAINASSDGDTVFVYNGTYYENVNVNKTINLTGEDRNSTIIDGGGYDDVVAVNRPWVNVSGFTTKNGGGGDFLFPGAGIKLGSYSTIFNNNICLNNNSGIVIFGTWNNITNNNISNNDVYGIYMCSPPFSASQNTISNNTFLNNSAGVSSEECHQNTVKDNIFLDNDNGGINLVFSNDWIISGNTIMNNNGSGIYLFEANNNTISDNKVVHNMGDGIHLWWLSNGNNIVNNNVSNNDNDGILLYFDCVDNNVIGNKVYSNNWSGITLAHYAEWNNISGNIVSLNNLWGIVMVDIYNGTNVTGNTISYNNGSGIYMELSRWNNITGNIISSNTEYGIYLVVDCDWNNITSNTISNNSYGIYVLDDSSTNNRIYHNDFINNNNSNSPQVFDDSNDGNFWDNGYPSGGNYWSDFDEPGEGAYDDYKGPNQDIPGGDDIVDNGIVGGGGKNPYVIDADSQDNYPFMGPFNKCMILKQGWNLISIPLIQEEKNLTRVLGSIDGWYDAVQWYDPSDSNDPWKHYKIGKPFGNDLFELNETKGFWIYITQPGDTIFLYNGTQPTSNQTITLYPGWSLVGYPSLRSYNRTQGLNNLTYGTHVDSIWTYNAATQKWKEIGPLDYFELGRGYWIHAKTTCIWEVPL